MTVDYSNASIMATMAPAEASPSPRSTPMAIALTGPIDLTVQLDNRHQLVITPDAPRAWPLISISPCRTRSTSHGLGHRGR
jgi:hypothetical protein